MSSAILGLGTDIIEVSRIRDSLAEYEMKFAQRLFSEAEVAYCNQQKDPAIRFSGRFAAKEAVAKAFGTGFGENLHWHDFEIINDSSGKPSVHLADSLKEKHPGTSMLISISHCQTYATATAIWIKN